MKTTNSMNSFTAINYTRTRDGGRGHRRDRELRKGGGKCRQTGEGEKRGREGRVKALSSFSRHRVSSLL